MAKDDDPFGTDSRRPTRSAARSPRRESFSSPRTATTRSGRPPARHASVARAGDPPSRPPPPRRDRLRRPVAHGAAAAAADVGATTPPPAAPPGRQGRGRDPGARARHRRHLFCPLTAPFAWALGRKAERGRRLGRHARRPRRGDRGQDPRDHRDGAHGPRDPLHRPRADRLGSSLDRERRRRRRRPSSSRRRSASAARARRARTSRRRSGRWSSLPVDGHCRRAAAGSAAADRSPAGRCSRSRSALSSAPKRNAMFDRYSHSRRITAPANAPYVAPYLPKFAT